MKVLFQVVAAVFLSAALYSCKVPYNPVVIVSHASYLVVEGIINTGNDSTIIKLSRTVNLNNQITTQPENGYKITIENNTNANTYDLKSIKSGVYAIGPLNLDKTVKYRLRIVTNNNKIYLSDFTSVKESPVIDSLSFSTSPQGLRTAVNTHDATNNTRYYRWEYTETWKFHSGFSSNYIAAGTKIVARNQSQNIFFCWKSANSADVVLASSAKLINDVIFDYPMSFVPAFTEKVSLGYSILVKQYALTEEAFNFWQNLKKNTENLGSIFDAQPSQIQGNIHNINDAAEPVFGYISAGTVQQKRLTILYTNWPQSWTTANPAYERCVMDTVAKAKYISEFLSFGATQVPIDAIVIPAPAGCVNCLPDTIGYSGSIRPCVDCTLTGSNKKPSYWPN